MTVYSVTDDVDLYLSQTIYGENKQFQTESLYPYSKVCAVVLVPKQLNMANFVVKIVKEPDIYSIGIAVILFAIARIILQRTIWKQWIFVLIKTWGVFWNQAKLKNVTSIEIAWDINLRAFSLFATVALSVIIFKNLMSQEYDEIDTVDQLIASNLTIVAPNFYQNDDGFWSHLKYL